MTRIFEQLAVDAVDDDQRSEPGEPGEQNNDNNDGTLQEIVDIINFVLCPANILEIFWRSLFDEMNIVQLMNYSRNISLTNVTSRINQTDMCCRYVLGIPSNGLLHADGNLRFEKINANSRFGDVVYDIIQAKLKCMYFHTNFISFFFANMRYK